MQINYAIAIYNRTDGTVAKTEGASISGPQTGSLIEFLRNAGENGWDLCASLPTGPYGMDQQQHSADEVNAFRDSGEKIALVFKKAA
jgi:hypothetical protein